MKRSSLLLSVLLVAGSASPALAKPVQAPAKSTPVKPASAPVKAAGAKPAQAPAKSAVPAKAVGTKAAPVPAKGQAPAQKAATAPASAVKKPVVVGSLAKQNKKPCYARPVQLVRVRGEVVEPRELSVTMCSGTANVAALDALSVLARPRDAAKPTAAEQKAYLARPLPKGKIKPKSKVKYRDPLFVTEHVLRVHPGLLVRLQKIANHYPGKIIEIVSGYRPDSRDTSRHHHGRALDLRVAGVTRENLRDFLRNFDETGVGYYPNSYFVHMDVRDAKGYWVDRSGPGEPADYGPWPADKDDSEQQRDALLKGALADIAGLRTADLSGASVTVRSDAARSTLKGRVKEPEQESDDMSEDEVKRVREEARRALQEL